MINHPDCFVYILHFRGKHFDKSGLYPFISAVSARLTEASLLFPKNSEAKSVRLPADENPSIDSLNFHSDFVPLW